MEYRFTLSRRECNALRGVAIIVLVLHNFVHFLPWGLSENEFTFHAERAQAFIAYLLNPDRLLPLQLLSYLGCHAIHIFFLLSGYGLAMKYEAQTTASMPAPAQFIWRHYLKLLPLLVVGWALYLSVGLATGHAVNVSLRDALPLLTMTANLLPHPEQHIAPGPFWFFGVIMQLYVAYRLVFHPLRHSHWRWAAPLLAIAAAIAVCYAVTNRTAMCYIHYNLPMGLPAFCIGLLVGRYAHRLPSSRHPMWSTIWICTFLLSVGCTLSPIVWPMLGICTAITIVGWASADSRRNRKWLMRAGKVSAGVGMVSAGIFALHPAVRTALLAAPAITAHPYLAALIMLAASISIGIGYHAVEKRIQNNHQTQNPL